MAAESIDTSYYHRRTVDRVLGEGEAQLYSLFPNSLSNNLSHNGPCNVYVLEGCRDHYGCQRSCEFYHHYVVVNFKDIGIAVLLELDKDRKGERSHLNVEKWTCYLPTSKDYGPINSSPV